MKSLGSRAHLVNLREYVTVVIIVEGTCAMAPYKERMDCCRKMSVVDPKKANDNI
uniref:Uncharacterized protein n=1 Tax=Anguilla anguilla TaxID=7936 RepID=A0A0E9TDL0_ANGAN